MNDRMNELWKTGTRKIRCREGWIFVRPAGSGFIVTATKLGSRQVPRAELNGYINELAGQLGGRAWGESAVHQLVSCLLDD